jgi:lysophospholipase L1-like esterase
LEAILQQHGGDWETGNFGVGGATVLRQGDTPYADQEDYLKALVSEPDVVIVCFGANASRSPNRGYIQESYVSDYISLIDAFAALPSEPEIWLCYPLKAHSGSYTISDTIIKDEIIPLITQVVSERDLPIIDFYTPFEDSRHLYNWDGIHPNANGARLMAEIVAAHLTGVRTNPDLNGDGIVDSADMCMIVEHWHTSEPSCDLAPPPFGDGIVDVLDLCVLSEYLFTYPGAAAYWKLDETEGDIAHDSAVDCIGGLVGSPAWQPAGGMVDGALEFDGVDDYVEADLTLDPREGSFSILAWVKGGASGQVIASQVKKGRSTGCLWLGIEALGRLTTGLAGADVILPASDTIVADGRWHRVGLVWDQSFKTSTLYVDEAEVVAYVEPTLPTIEGGLRIGAGRDLGPDSFWSGLIDDVRIYRRVVRP